MQASLRKLLPYPLERISCADRGFSVFAHPVVGWPCKDWKEWQSLVEILHAHSSHRDMTPCKIVKTVLWRGLRNGACRG